MPIPPPGREDQSQGCPTCRSSLIGDVDKGELVCSKCGLVIQEGVEDRGPEWKALDFEDKQKRIRVGAPTTLALHDYGLTTEIGNTRKDSHGRSLDTFNRNAAENMRKWQARIRTSSSAERSLSNVLSRITAVCQAMNLPRNVSETAAHLYRASMKMKVAKSKSISGMTAASVYLACRKCGVGRSIKEIARATRIEKGDVAKYYRLLLKEVEKDYVPPTSVERYISKLVNMAEIDPKVERLALSLASKTNDIRISSGKAPAGLAAAYVYISSVLLDEHIPQREVAEVAEVTEVTVRNRCREILNNFLIRQKLRPAAS
ncbi:MAG: transcription factor IIB [Thaumarchaeota archaeon]|nr:transcription factor IIB [Nitrososphaerota archaeon]